MPLISILSGLIQIENEAEINHEVIKDFAHGIEDSISKQSLLKLQNDAPGVLNNYLKIVYLTQGYVNDPYLNLKSFESMKKQFKFMSNSEIEISASAKCFDRISKISNKFGMQDAVKDKIKILQ